MIHSGQSVLGQENVKSSSCLGWWVFTALDMRLGSSCQVGTGNVETASLNAYPHAVTSPHCIDRGRNWRSAAPLFGYLPLVLFPTRNSDTVHRL